MDVVLSLITQSLAKVWLTFLHNWPFLLVSVIVAVLLKLYLKPDKVAAFLTKYQRAGVVGATVAAVATPLCSCGSTAVVLGMMASLIPWAPVVAFMVSSPLTSPEELIYSAGLFGWPFAIVFFVSSILLGLFGGLVAGILERRGLLANQSRFNNLKQAEPVRQSVTPIDSEQTCCSAAPSPRLTPLEAPLPTRVAASKSFQVAPVAVEASSACCGGSAPPVDRLAEVRTSDYNSENIATTRQRFDWQAFAKEGWAVSSKLLVMFLGFAFIGYLLNGLIPAEWVSAVFGTGNAYSVPLAATLGLPLYINTEGSLPLVRAMLDNGMSQGAALAFLITGAGTSIGALGGALTIARWRIIALVVGILWAGAILMGFGYDMVLRLGLVM